MNPLLGATLVSVGGGLINNLLQNKSLDKQVAAQKELMDYQWKNYQSPLAQAQNFAAAGFNPAVAMGNGNVTSMSPSAPSVTAPVYSTGIENLSQLANYMKSVAEAKKAGVDTTKSEQEIKNMQIKQQADEFELELRKVFARPQLAVELRQAYANVLNAQDTHDINQLEKAIKEWSKAKEKAEAETSEHNRDIAKKVLDNYDTKLKLENRESEARGTASYASAEASKASAQLSKEQAKTESDLRELRVTAQTLSNGISALNYDLDSKTLQSKVEEIANRVGAVKWSNLMAELQYKDASTYNAIQRLLRGNSQAGDIGQILKALKNYEELKIPK